MKISVLKDLTTYLKAFNSFIGPRVQRLLIIDIAVGFLWFIVESSFIFVFQGFLASIGLIEPDLAFLPSWYPSSFDTNVMILLLFGFFRCLSVMLKNYCVIYTSQVFVCEKRCQLLDNALLNRNLVSNNQIISTFSELVTQAGSHVINGTHLAHGLIITLLFGLACLKIAFWESMAGIIFLAITLVPLKVFTKRVSVFSEQMIHNWNISYTTLLDGLKNIFFLRIHEMTKTEAEKGKRALINYENNYKSYATTSSLMLGLPQFIGILVLCTTAWLSIRYFHTKASALVAFFYLFIRLAQNASQTYNYASYFRLTSLSFIKLKDLLVNFTSIKKHSQLISLDPLDGIEINLENLIIGYEDKSPLTTGINLKFGMSEMFLVKGPSGSGKSTLLKTILGEIPALSGNVFVNNIEVTELNNLSAMTGYVGPEPFLIYGTVRENLEYGKKNKHITDEIIWTTLREVGLEEKIASFPKKLDEILLDETQLSSGQKQRLSFARALLRSPKLLILDEATANIDFETESRIIEVIKDLKPQMTIFVISHKSSFDDLADKRLDFSKE